GANVSLRDDTGGVTLGTTTATGALSVESNGGGVGQASGTSISSGSTTVSARNADNSAADITMGNAGNDLGGTVSTDGASVSLRDDTGGVTLGTITAMGALSVESHGGSVGQASGTNVSVTGTTQMTARIGDSAADINLGNGDNDFVGPVSTNGANVSLRDDTGGVTLGTTTATGGLSVASNGGGVGQASGTSISSGSATVTARNGNAAADITLGNAGNDLGGTVSTDGASVSLRDDTGGVTLGTTTATGGLSVASNGGGVGQASGTSVSVTGTTQMTARIGDSAADINLDSRANLFGGLLTADGRDVTVDIDGPLDIDVTASGDTEVRSRGDLNATLDVHGKASLASIGGDLVIGGHAGSLQASSDGGVKFLAMSADGTMSVTAHDDVTQTGPISAGGQARLKSEIGSVRFSGGNSFGAGLIRDDQVSRSSADSVTGGTAGNANVPRPEVPAVDAPASPLSTGTTTRPAGGNPSASNTVPADGGASRSDLSGGPEQSAGRPGVNVADSPAWGTGGIIYVTIPVSRAKAETSFSFSISDRVRREVSGADGTETVLLENGKALPGWLKYDPKEKQFTATGAPDKAFPLKVVLKVGDVALKIVIDKAGRK
ncbi:MAG: hypothetical protein HGB04_01940, partial [Chlorobiaceae bacterium]|nr:hypothetical protein [Chlorobiaceae bacterium]